MPTDFSFDPETGEIRDGGGHNAGAFTVSEISHALKRTIEDRFGYVRVRGEISGFKGPHSSGHCYFSLKDEGAKIDAVVWRGTFSRLRGKLQEGLEVIASGKLTSYPGKSSYQIVIENVEPAGVGALMALLEERRKKLAAEGLFDAARKKPLPYLPERIGVITSPTGAVIRDILHRLNDRFPRPVTVWPVRVQGETAAAEVVAAIQGFNAMENPPDLLIVARGGGSLEDLWPFNDEAIVRAVAASRIPIISAIGHETDTTLIDHAADWRAPTPTAAAEKAVPVRADLLAETASLLARQRRAMARVMQERHLRLQSAARAVPKPEDMLAIARQRLDGVTQRLPASLRANVQRHGLGLARASGRFSVKPMQQRAADHARRLADAQHRSLRALKLILAGRADHLDGSTKQLSASLRAHVQRHGLALARTASRLSAKPLQQRATDHARRVTDAQVRGARALRLLLARRADRFDGASKLLLALSYRSVLSRGFALVRDDRGQPLRSAAAVTPGMALTLEFGDGTASAVAKPADSAKDRQGRLF